MIDPKIRQIIAPELAEGEELLWAGPSQGFSINPTDWIFIDIGFGGRKNDGRIGKSTGLKLPGLKSSNETWADTSRKIVDFLEQRDSAVNIMIEAPLSVAFDISGNPAPRSFEKTNKGARYWYVPMGTNVAMSALLMLGNIRKNLTTKVNLFEAIVSFKTRKTDHSSDTEAMFDAVINSSMQPLKDFRQKPSDIVESLGSRVNWDFGIPPVFVVETKS